MRHTFPPCFSLPLSLPLTVQHSQVIYASLGGEGEAYGKVVSAMSPPYASVVATPLTRRGAEGIGMCRSAAEEGVLNPEPQSLHPKP